jgi:biotin carboxylase
MAASLREHLRIPGMGETTTRYFRDKLAMRMKASERGLNVPEFVHILNHDRVREFTERVPPPWVLKPRQLAGSIGIRKLHGADELWPLIESMGDEQSFFLLERYVPGEVCHVDSIVYENEVLFAVASVYGRPPLDVSHGGIFTTRILERGSTLEQALIDEHGRVMKGLGLLRGVSHTEYIHAADGKLYFLETAARVGGAHIAELVEAATGLNLWAEWAKVELAGGKAPYSVVPARSDYAGLLVSLARDEHPDTSGYADPEIVWRIDKSHHVGLIFRSPDPARIRALLDHYVERVQAEHLAVLPPQSKPTS